MRSLSERIQAAQTADEKALWAYVRDHHPDVISAAVLNRNLTEGMAVSIAGNRQISSETLEFLSSDVRFKDSYKLKLTLCRNPRTPQRITLSLLKFLRIFDLAELTKDQHIPAVLRQKIEYVVMEKIRSLPSGVKIALARKANSTIVMALLADGDERVIQTCLDSPALTEGHLYRMLNRPRASQPLIRMIGEHSKWSLRYLIRFALVRNFFTPMNFVLSFVRAMKTTDLKELYRDPKVPASTRPFIYRELLERNETVEEESDVVYDLPDEGDAPTTVTGEDLR